MPTPTSDLDVAQLTALVERAREAVIRARPSWSMEQVGEWAAQMTERIEARTPSRKDLVSLHRWSREFFRRQRRTHRFAGVYLTKAFELAIKGLHYETAMRGVVSGHGFHREIRRGT